MKQPEVFQFYVNRPEIKNLDRAFREADKGHAAKKLGGIFAQVGQYRAGRRISIRGIYLPKKWADQVSEILADYTAHRQKKAKK